MNIVIKRLFTKGEYTHGSLSIDGTKICSTLEIVFQKVCLSS